MIELKNYIGGELVGAVSGGFIDDIEPATGEVINADTGFAEISTDPELPGVQPGIYRVEITSPSVDISPNYNENTVYGIEVAPIQQESPRRHFNVKRR